MVRKRVRYPMGAKKVTEPGTLRQKTETIYGTREVLVQKRHKYFQFERPVEGNLAYQRFTLGNTAIFDVLGDGVPAEAFSLDDVDLHLERDEVDVLVQRAVMVHFNRTLASELEQRLATYEAAGEEE